MIVPMSVLPVTFAECGFAPKSLGQFDLGLGVFWHQNRDDIKAMIDFLHVKNSSIELCGTRDLPLFAFVYVSNNRREFVGAARLNLDKTERFAIESDNVDLAGYGHAFAVAADRDLEI